MVKISFRKKALNDLNSIWFYTYENWSEYQANKYYFEIKSTCFKIGKNPKLGKNYDNISINLLGVKSGKHIIFYHSVSKKEIQIIRILHERMDIKNRLLE